MAILFSFNKDPQEYFPHTRLDSPLCFLLASEANQYKIQIIQNKSLSLITKADTRNTNKFLHRALKIPPINSYSYTRLDKLRDKLTDDRLYQRITRLN